MRVGSPKLGRMTADMDKIGSSPRKTAAPGLFTSHALSHSFTPDTPDTPGMPHMPHMPHIPALSLWSADLSWPQRAMLVGVVAALHGLVLWLVMRWPVQPLNFPEPPVITAQLVSDAPRSLPVPAPAHVEPPPAHPQSKTPAPAREHVAPRSPVMAAPAPLLASPKPAQINETVVPVAESRAVPSPSAMTAPTTVRAQKDVASDAPVAAERARHESNDRTISPADYLVKPPNDYPADAYDAGESGTVKFEVLIDESGRPEDFKIARSSGSPRLDRQARRNVMRARFKPRTENGQAWKGWLHGQMTFTAPD